MNLQTAPKRFDDIASNYVTSEVHRSSASMSYVQAFFAGRTNLRVVDLACGAGHFGFSLAPLTAELSFCDPSPAMLRAVQARADETSLKIFAAEGTAEAMPFDSGSFDVVLSRLAPHHFVDLERAAQEIARVLAPGGQCVIIDLEGMFDGSVDALNHQLEVLHDPTHGRSYTQIEWCQALRGAGLTLIEVQGGISESETGVTIERWCEIARSGDAARREIDAVLAVASPQDLATLGIWHDGAGFRMPVRTVMFIAQKP